MPKTFIVTNNNTETITTATFIPQKPWLYNDPASRSLYRVAGSKGVSGGVINFTDEQIERFNITTDAEGNLLFDSENPYTTIQDGVILLDTGEDDIGIIEINATAPLITNLMTQGNTKTGGK